MIPIELQQAPNWVNWRYETDSKGEPTKVPYHALSGHKAKVNDSRYWVDYATACAAMATGHYSGVGFVLTQELNITFTDLDDPKGDAAIAERHGKVIAMLDSYTEWSPSGKGMHVLTLGTVPDGRRRKKMEMYSHGRFMTVTGNTYIDKPLANRQEIALKMHAELGNQDVLVVVKDEPQKLSDFDVYERMMNATNGDKVLSIWNCETHGDGGDGTHSAGDQALINYLQFYTHNSEQITRMFLKSPRAYRLVSGEKHKYAKYIPDMIQKSYDRELPDIDFEVLRALPVSLQVISNPTEIDITTPDTFAEEYKPIAVPPGLVGEIAHFIYQQAPLPVVEIALAGALGLMAGICGRAYNVSDEGLNLYILLLARTGTGKEAAAKGISKLMRAVEALTPAASEFRGPSEIASGPALTKQLIRTPCCFSILGEFGLRLHQMCNEQAQGNMIGLRRVLLDLFHKSGKDAEVLSHIYSDKEKNTDKLYSPAYTILGESTPETFYRHLDESMLTDGLLPRFTVIEYKGDRVSLSKTFMDAEPSSQLVQRLSDLCTFCLEMQNKTRVLPLQYTPDARAMYHELSEIYRIKINSERDNEVAAQLLNRAHLKVQKLAGLVAVGMNPISPTITLDYMNWAIGVIDGDNENVIGRFRSGKIGRENGDMNQVDVVLSCIKKYAQRPYDTTMKKYRVLPEMHATKIIPLSYIQRIVSTMSAFKFDRLGPTFAITRAIQALVYEGVLREVKATQLLTQFNTSMKAYAVIDKSVLLE